MKMFLFYFDRIPSNLLRGFSTLIKSVPEGEKFCNTSLACGEDKNFEDFTSLFATQLYRPNAVFLNDA